MEVSWGLTYRECQKSLLQKCLSIEILSIYPRESGGTGFLACADKGLNLKDIILIFFNKEHHRKLRVMNGAPTFNTHLHRLESLCHQPKMNFASGSKVLPLLKMLQKPKSPRPPFGKGGEYAKALLKSLFEKGGFRDNMVHLSGSEESVGSAHPTF